MTARRLIKRGETIKYLSGVQVMLSGEEERDLGLRRTDFSIVVSSRKKSASIFLGPARFANHDCDANARLVTTGLQGMEVMAVREIETGEEITVTYGDDYFGVDNCECLCKTCESLGRNGWASKDGEEGDEKPAVPMPSEQLNIDGPYSFRRKRKYVSDRDSMTPTATPELRPPPVLKKRRSKRGLAVVAVESFDSSQPSATATKDSAHDCSTCPAIHMTQSDSHSLSTVTSSAGDTDLNLHTSDSPCESSLIMPERPAFLFPKVEDDGDTRPHADDYIASEVMPEKSASNDKGNHSLGDRVATAGSKQRRSAPSETEILAIPAPIPTIENLREMSDEHPSTDSNSPSSSAFDEIHKENASTDASSVSDDAAAVDSTATRPRFIDEDTIVVGRAVRIERDPKKPRRCTLPAAESTLSKVPNAGLDKPAMTMITRSKKTRPTKKKPTERKAKVLPSIDVDPSRHTPKIRAPGDYVLTESLLCESYSAWIFCTICEAAFVQPDAYFTRSACPRCERHSKLYGYAWPKTERTGKGDKEQRVADHRTVHRFIRPDEEKEIKKGKVRDLSRRSVTVDSEREESQGVEEIMTRTRAGRSRRGRFTL